MSTFENERPRQDQGGKRWHFHYWQSDFRLSEKSQRLFFWDDEKTTAGVVLFLPGATRPYVAIANLITKLVAEPALREKYKRELKFPLDRNYATYPIFPEELESSQ